MLCLVNSGQARDSKQHSKTVDRTDATQVADCEILKCHAKTVARAPVVPSVSRDERKTREIRTSCSSHNLGHCTGLVSLALLRDLGRNNIKREINRPFAPDQ